MGRGEGEEKWHETLPQEKKWKYFTLKNLKSKEFAAELRENEAESFCEAPGLVLSSARRYLGL